MIEICVFHFWQINSWESTNVGLSQWVDFVRIKCRVLGKQSKQEENLNNNKMADGGQMGDGAQLSTAIPFDTKNQNSVFKDASLIEFNVWEWVTKIDFPTTFY